MRNPIEYHLQETGFFRIDWLATLWLLPALLLVLAAMAFLGLCVYNDARSRRNPNAALWGVLSGFLAVAAIPYAVSVFSSRTRMKESADHVPDGRAAYCRRRTLFLVLWAGAVAAAVIWSVVVITIF